MRAGFRYHALFLVIVGLLIGVVALPEVPALSDFPNHMARVHVLTHLQSPGVNRFYDGAWGPYPNLAFDLFGVFVVPGLSAITAGKLFLALTIATWCSACVRLGAAVTGRPSLRALVACTFVLNEHFLQGYANYAFGMALAVHALATLIAERRRAVDFAGLALLSLGTAVSHGAALVTLFVFCFAVALGGVGKTSSLRSRLPGCVVAAAPGFAYLAHWTLRYASRNADRAFSPIGASVKHLLFSIVPSLNRSVDLLVLAGFVIAIVVLAYAARKRGVVLPMLIGSALLALLVFIAPSEFAGTYEANGRYALGAWTLALFVLKPAPLVYEKLELAAFGLVCLLSTVRFAALAKTELELGTELAAERRVLALFPVGATLGNVTYLSEGDRARALRERSLLHAPALAVIDREVNLPTLYAIPGAQPLVHKQPKVTQHRISPQHKVDVERMRADLDGAWLCRVPADIREQLVGSGTSLGRQGDCELVLFGK